MARNLLQCVIQNYTGPRTFDALQIPHGYVIKNVRLPNSINIQVKPLEKSIVFVAQVDDFQAYFVSIIRDPIGFLEKSNIGVQGSVNDKDLDRSENEFEQGEVYFEARGESKDISGAGGTIYLANDGTVNLHSGRRKESIIIGGTDDEDDGEIVITADNGFFESNIDDVTKIRSTVKFDETNMMEIGNSRVLVPDVGVETDISETPIVNLIMEPDGELTMGNFNLLGLDRNKLNMTPGGDTSLTTFSLLGAEVNKLEMLSSGTTSLTTFSPLGAEMNKLEMSPIGTTTLDATIINLNNGIQPAARQEDLTIISTTTDALFLTYLTLLDSFMTSVFTFFNLHTHIGNLGGPTSPPVPLLTIAPPTHPSTITGKINLIANSSASVLIGD